MKWIKKNEILKQKVKSWWSKHSQIYVDPGVIDQKGVKHKMTKKEFHNFLKNIDKNFYLDAYFAEDKEGSFFSKLMPKNIKNKKVLKICCGLGSTQKPWLKKSYSD